MSKVETGAFYAYAKGGVFEVLQIALPLYVNQGPPKVVTLRRVGAPNDEVWSCPFELFDEGMTEGVELFRRVPSPALRPSWDAYFIQMCHLVSTRATCDRKHVGAVLVRDRRILCTGYNGAVAGEPHCDEVGHDLMTLADGSVNCVRSAHAEMNCVAQAAQNGVSLLGTTAYINTFPCWNCARMLVSVGVRRIVFDSNYRNDLRVTALCESRQVSLEQWGGSETLRSSRLGDTP